MIFFYKSILDIIEFNFVVINKIYRKGAMLRNWRETTNSIEWRDKF